MSFKDIARLALAFTICLLWIVDTAMADTTPAGTIQEPNITGVWERYPSPFPEGDTGFEDLQPPGNGPDLKDPYASQWKAQAAKRQAALDAGTPLVDNSTRCLPEGMPTIMQAVYPIQILQTPGQITVLAEIFMQTRRIYIDQPFPAPDDLAPSYYGFSSAHWDGNTLVVKTRGVKTDVRFFEIPHSDAMTITEHYTLTKPDMLKLDISIEDPSYLKTPYRFTYEYKRNDKYRIGEYVCDASLTVFNPDGTVSVKVN
ncbi:hypothetical protein GE253_21500 [Niveispirillum sp. SYP-B3756]|uniref:hypothetical protein n=1 Tax=Niveispirillum sp. SYP-B3756 TaxID=2662178 RepID=UPI0012921434|nr:hypothetical protein [Niveispirillum sp. SYP-B3756]MQP67899.1 hypothetical protein [Niveispirillum sp. SYP-B3756]